jgi:hypothetical protein
MAKITMTHSANISGDCLYQLILVNQPQLADKITGMLLEGLDSPEIVTLIDDQVALQSKVEEALAALHAHQEAQKALAALPPQGQSPRRVACPTRLSSVRRSIIQTTIQTTKI